MTNRPLVFGVSLVLRELVALPDGGICESNSSVSVSSVKSILDPRSKPLD